MEVDEGSDKHQTSSLTGWLRMRVCRMSLRKTNSCVKTSTRQIPITVSFLCTKVKEYKRKKLLENEYSTIPARTFFLADELLCQHLFICLFIYLLTDEPIL